MTNAQRRPLLLFPLLTLLLIACSEAPPPVAQIYAKGIERAWKQATGGKSPNNACAHVIAAAVAHMKSNTANQSSAAQAYQACYVDVRTRYVQTQLASKSSPSCNSLRLFLHSGRSALGGLADDVGLRLEDLDARIAERIGTEVSAACPAMADAMLRR